MSDRKARMSGGVATLLHPFLSDLLIFPGLGLAKLRMSNVGHRTTRRCTTFASARCASARMLLVRDLLRLLGVPSYDQEGIVWQGLLSELPLLYLSIVTYLSIDPSIYRSIYLSI